MDKRTRTLNAMDCLPVDRVPVNFYRHLFTFGKTEEEQLAGQLAWFHESGMDFLLEETDGYMEFPLEGDPHDFTSWKRLKPLRKDNPYFVGQIERTKRLLDGLDGACLFYILYTPFSTIKHTIRDETTVMHFYRDHPKELADVMAILDEQNFELAERLVRETDTTGFFISLQNAEKNRFSPQEYQEFLAPWDRHLIDGVNRLSKYNIIHMCSWTGVPNNIGLWKDYHYKVVNWSVNIEENLSMKEGRKFFGSGTALMGGFDNRSGCILHAGSKKQIQDFTTNLLKEVGETGTILCADCSVQNDQSAQNIRYVVEASEAYAKAHKSAQKG